MRIRFEHVLLTALAVVGVYLGATAVAAAISGAFDHAAARIEHAGRPQ